jgi:plastocyanin
MRHLIVSLLVLAVAGCSDPASPVPNTADVFTPGFVFSPFSTTIAAGGSVNFHITGDDHNVIFGRLVAGAPPDIIVVKDTMIARTFSTRGTFPYDCTVHPGMTGEIVVK